MQCDIKHTHLEQVEKKNFIKNELIKLKKQVDENEVESKHELDIRINILQIYGFIDNN